MAKGNRGPNWSHDETTVLAELRKEAFLNKNVEGRLVWEQIAQIISSRFPTKKRSHDQCRRRWDTLTKVCKHIEEYCALSGQDHWQLKEDELSSMKLDTAYGQDWYNLVKQVCSQRKRKEKRPGDCTDSTAMKQRKRPHVCADSQSTPMCPEPTLGREDSRHVAVSSGPSLEVEKLISPEEEIRRLKRENDALTLELAQLRQPGQIAQQNQMLEPTYQVVQDSFSVENRVRGKEALEDEVTVECSSLADPFDASTFFISTPFFPAMEFWELGSSSSPAVWKDGLRYVLLYSVLNSKGYYTLNLKLYGVHLRVAEAGALDGALRVEFLDTVFEGCKLVCSAAGAPAERIAT